MFLLPTMDSDEEVHNTSWKGVRATIVVINTYNHDIAKIALESTCRVIRHYLQLSGPQLVGVCLYGCKDLNTSSLDIKNVVEIFPLTLPTINDYKKIQNVNISSLVPAKELILSDVLWHCSKMFANCKKQLSSRSIMLLSNLVMAPIYSDQNPTLRRICDLVDSDVDINLINISQSDHNVNIFYHNLLSEANKGKETTIQRPLWDPKEIEQVMHQESHRNLAVAKLCFEIGGGLSIGVGVYKLLKSFNKKTYNLDSDTNAPITSVTKTMKVTIPDPEQNMEIDGEENSELQQVPLLKSELIKYQEFGGERIEFTDNEIKLMKNPFGPPILKLLGFKPSALLCKEKWFLKACHFLFPNESLIEGSTIAFNALHNACVETNTVAICVLSTRVNAKPSLVALSPCKKPLGLDVELGFDIIKLPFIEDVRNVPGNEDLETTEISEAQRNAIRVLVSSISFDYTADMFEDPKLQSEYKALEAIALDEVQESFLDTTKPNCNKFQDLNEESFLALFGPFGDVATKRNLTDDNNSSTKRLKVDSSDECFQSLLQNKQIDQYKVSQLKDILKNKNIPDLPALTGLKKHELVDLVYKYFK